MKFNRLTIRYLLIIASLGYIMAWTKPSVVPNSTGRYNPRFNALFLQVIKYDGIDSIYGIIKSPSSDAAFDIPYRLNDSTVLHYNTLTKSTYYKVWNHAIIGGSSFSYNGNGSLSLSSGDTIEINSALGVVTGYSALLNMSNVYVMPVNGLVKFTNTLDVSNWTNVDMIGTIISGSGGVTDSRSSNISQMAGKTCGFMFTVNTGNIGCINLGGTSVAHCKFQYILNTGSSEPFFNMSGGAWTGTTATKSVFQDTMQYCWSRNSAMWIEKGPTGNNKGIADSTVFQYDQEDSSTVIVAWNFLGFHMLFDNIYSTAVNPSLTDDGLDEGWFYMSNCMGGSTMSNIKRMGAHWGWLARIGAGGYDFQPFKMFNIINDYSITYGFLDLRGTDTAFDNSNFPVTGFTWHCPTFSYVYNITNGNNSNARSLSVGGYITAIVWYGNWNPNGGCYFWDIAQFNQTQYSSYPDSSTVINFSNPAQPTLISVTNVVYNANGLNLLQDTNSTWMAKSGGPLIGTGTNSPIAQVKDIYGVTSSKLIGAANTNAPPTPCGCINGFAVPHSYNYKKHNNENTIAFIGTGSYDWSKMPNQRGFIPENRQPIERNIEEEDVVIYTGYRKSRNRLL